MAAITFSGIIVPMVTPFEKTNEQAINYGVGCELADRLIDAGVDGIFTFGSNGEFHVCTDDERIEFSAALIRHSNGRVPVIVGTGACSTRATIELSLRAQEVGASAVSVVNPYFLGISTSELAQHFAAVAEALDIPVLLYNIPKATGHVIPAEVLAEVAPISNICGIKDSSGDLSVLKEYVQVAQAHNVDVLVGSDGKISAAYELGVSGTVAGTANLITSVVVDLWQALCQGNKEAADQLQAEIEPLRDVLHEGSVPQVIKRALELSGVAVGCARRPVLPTTPEVDKQILSMLAHYGLSTQP